MQWTNSLVARFHGRTPSFKAQGAPLIQSKGSKRVSEPLGAVREDDAVDDVPDEKTSSTPTLTPIPSSANSSADRMVTATDGKATAPAVAVSTHDKRSIVRFLEKESKDLEANVSSRMRSIKSFLMEEVDGAQASAPLSAYCFMTGFIDSVCFSAIFVWCAFQTGNSVQLALALARLFNGQHDYSFHLADQQALCSVITFIFGAFIGRLGDKIGCKTRAWMSLGTFIQTLFTMVAAITIWQSHQGSVADSRADPAWSNTLSFVCIGFMSASMGLQGIMGKRLNTQFTTTVVLTTTWCELMTEPQLFHIRRLVVARDHKIMAIVFLFIGGFIGRALIDQIGSAGTLGVGTAIRLLITVWWFLVPAKKGKP